MKASEVKTILQRRVKTTDKQIDEVAYDLYELTGEEIKNVEEEEK